MSDDRLNATTPSEAVMPKMKSHRGAAKRFKITKSGRIKFRRSYRNHILTKKSAKRMRHLRKAGYMKPMDGKKIIMLLPYI